MPGYYIHGNPLHSTTEARYGMLLVLKVSPYAVQIDISFGGKVFVREMNNVNADPIIWSSWYKTGD